MKFHIYTQYLENYGDADKPYWKNKGGEEYIIDVPGFCFDDEFAFKKGQMIVDELSSKIEYSNSASQEFIIGWGFVDDEYMTQEEEDQMEYEGRVVYPAKRLSYDELMETA